MTNKSVNKISVKNLNAQIVIARRIKTISSLFFNYVGREINCVGGLKKSIVNMFGGHFFKYKKWEK